MAHLHGSTRESQKRRAGQERESNRGEESFWVGIDFTSRAPERTVRWGRRRIALDSEAVLCTKELASPFMKVELGAWGWVEEGTIEALHSVYHMHLFLQGVCHGAGHNLCSWVESRWSTNRSSEVDSRSVRHPPAAVAHKVL